MAHTPSKYQAAVYHFIEEGKGNAVVVSRILSIFNDKAQGICLATIHKSKGLECERVFILCPDKMMLDRAMQIEWMAEQERNLVYVAYTRAKSYLGFITDYEQG